MDAPPNEDPRSARSETDALGARPVSKAFELLARGLRAWTGTNGVRPPVEVEGPEFEPVRLVSEPRKPVFMPRQDLVREVDGTTFVCLGSTLVGIDDALLADSTCSVGEAGHAFARALATTAYLESLESGEFERVLSRALAPRERSSAWRAAAPDRVVVWMQELARRGSKVPRALRAAASVAILSDLRAIEREPFREPDAIECLTLARAFLWSAMFFDGREVDEWRLLGASLLTRALATDDPAEGARWVEPSELPRVAGDLLECLATLEPCPLADRTFRALRTHAQRLADLLHADGGVTTLGHQDERARREPGEVLDAIGRCQGRRFVPRRRIWRALERLFVLRQASALAVHRARVEPEEGRSLSLDLEWSVFGERIVLGGRHTGHAQNDTGPAARLVRWLRRGLCKLPGTAPSGKSRIVKACALGEGFHVRTLTTFDVELAHRPLLERRVDMRTSELVVEERASLGAGGTLSIDLHPAVRVRRRDASSVLIESGRARIEVASTRSIRVARTRTRTEPFLELETTMLEIEIDPAEPAGWLRFVVLRPGSVFAPPS